MVEINPLVLTKNDEIIALDGKVGFDGNAHFRHRELWDEMRDLQKKMRQKSKQQNLICLMLISMEILMFGQWSWTCNGNNGRIKLYGGEPANFLDVGGGANEEQVKTAFISYWINVGNRAIFLVES